MAIARARVAGALAEVLANLVLPFAIFVLGRGRFGDVPALMVASLAPLAWSLVEFVRKRRVDALSLIVLAGIVFSLVAMLGGGSVRFLQLREQVVIGLIGTVFLGSAAIDRPLIYYLARARLRRRSAEEAAGFEARRGEEVMRRTMMTLTLVWGLALVSDALVCAALVFAMPIATFLVVAPVLGYGAVAMLTVWTFWFAKRRLRRPTVG
jgi:hypothetical protein